MSSRFKRIEIICSSSILHFLHPKINYRNSHETLYLYQFRSGLFTIRINNTTSSISFAILVIPLHHGIHLITWYRSFFRLTLVNFERTILHQTSSTVVMLTYIHMSDFIVQPLRILNRISCVWYLTITYISLKCILTFVISKLMINRKHPFYNEKKLGWTKNSFRLFSLGPTHI